jgi:hypothetical protein
MQPRPSRQNCTGRPRGGQGLRPEDETFNYRAVQKRKSLAAIKKFSASKINVLVSMISETAVILANHHAFSQSQKDVPESGNSETVYKMTLWNSQHPMRDQRKRRRKRTGLLFGSGVAQRDASRRHVVATDEFFSSSFLFDFSVMPVNHHPEATRLAERLHFSGSNPDLVGSADHALFVKEVRICLCAGCASSPSLISPPQSGSTDM